VASNFHFAGAIVRPWAVNREPSKADLDEIPEVTDAMVREVTAERRPNKAQLTIRLDADVSAWLRGLGRGYQTKLNAMLREAMLASRRSARAK
jgi:uncharacterized protein (DUF4415 family)